jgi:hypothetical protein
MITHATFGVSRFIGLGAVRGAMFWLGLKTYMTYNNLPSTTVRACDELRQNGFHSVLR